MGIRSEFDGLLIEPCLPEEIKECSITRAFRGKKYIIDITNNNTGKTVITTDGVLNGNIVSASDDICHVKVNM